MNYFVIGLVAIAVLVALKIVVKMVKNYRYRKFLEEDIAWQIARAREMGVPMSGIRFDEYYNLIDPRTGKPVVYGSQQ